jgi:hypothetical protein
MNASEGLVVCLGLGTLTEQQHLMRSLLARAAIGIRRVRFADWLEELESRSTRIGGRAR